MLYFPLFGPNETRLKFSNKLQHVKRVLDLNCTIKRFKQFNFFNWLLNVKI